MLLNGETGNILLFDDIDITVLDELQSAIDNADADGLSVFFGKYFISYLVSITKELYLYAARSDSILVITVIPVFCNLISPLSTS